MHQKMSKISESCKQSTCSQRIVSTVKQADFTEPIRPTFNGEKIQNSRKGGCCSKIKNKLNQFFFIIHFFVIKHSIDYPEVAILQRASLFSTDWQQHTALSYQFRHYDTIIFLV